MDRYALRRYQSSFLKRISQADHCEKLESSIIPVGKLDKLQSLNVYRDDYYARLVEALGENFETIWAVLGDEEFFKLARDYIKNYPSNKKNLNSYGDRLPQFLEKSDHRFEFPFIIDLAKFEIEFWKLFHLRKEIGEFEFINIDEKKLSESRIKFITGIKVFSWENPLYDFWLQRENGLHQTKIDINQSQNIVLYKNSDRVNCQTLNLGQFNVFNKLLEGVSLVDALNSTDISQVEIQDLFAFISSAKIVHKLF